MLSEDVRRRDLPGTIIALVFIALAGLVWWDTIRMADADSYVFPRMLAVALTGFSLLLIVRNLIWGGGRHHKSAEGSISRRIGLVAMMLGGALLMPVLGFLPAGIVVFWALTWMAMYDPWTKRRIVVFPLVGVAVVLTFFILFSEFLHVPLPVGTVFE